MAVDCAPSTLPAAVVAEADGVTVAGATVAAGVTVDVDTTCVETTVGWDDSQLAPVGTNSVFVTVCQTCALSPCFRACAFACSALFPRTWSSTTRARAR